MTISLRSFSTFALAAVAALTISACGNDVTSPTRGFFPSSANRDGKVGDVGNARKNGAIDVNVVLDKFRNATIEVHTGTFDDLSNTPHPNGYFESIQYKVYNATGKQVLVRNVNFKKSAPSEFIEAIPLCKESDDSDDDVEAGDTSCAVKFLDGWTVSVQANLKAVDGDPKKTDVVRSDGYVMWAPDINMVPQPITYLDGSPLGAVAPNVLTKFRVLIPNNKPTPIALGATVSCAIFIDGVRQTVGNANGFAYLNGSTFSIGVNGSGDCQFQAKLTAAAHTIEAAAENVVPDDYDYSNNRTGVFTVAAIASAPDVDAKNQIFSVNGAANTATTTVGTGTLVQLGQNLKLLSGTPPGTVTCTVSIAPSTGFTLSSNTATATLAVNGAQGLCTFPVTFSAAGDYTVTTVVTMPNGVTDADLTNNTATSVVHVVPSPMASVSLTQINYSDPTLNTILGNSPTAVTSTLSTTAANDSVHNNETATFSAPLTFTLQYTNSVTVNCSATINGLAATAANFPGLVWNTQSLAITPTTQNAACSFTLPFNDTNFSLSAGKPYTVVFTVSTVGIANSAPTSQQTVTGALMEYVRVDLSVDPFQVLLTPTSAPVPLTGNGVPQATTVTVQAPIHNPSNLSVVVNCGTLATNNVQPTGFTLPAADTPLPTELAASTQTATVTIPANGVGLCKYSLTSPTTLGLIAIPIVALELTSTTALNNPQDGYPQNNAAAGVFQIKSNGEFTGLPPANAGQSIVGLQDWHNAPTNVSSTIDTLYHQKASVTNLALKVIPTQSLLGNFTLTTTVTSGGVTAPLVTFGQSVISGALHAAASGENCDEVQASPGSILTGQSQTEPTTYDGFAALRYTGSVCAQAVAGNQQQINVNYTQDIFHPILGSGSPLLFKDTVYVRMVLDFTLTNAPSSDRVSATIKIPVNQFWTGTCPLASSGLYVGCASSFGQFKITTP